MHRLQGDLGLAMGVPGFHKQGETAEAYDVGHQHMLSGRQGSH